MLSGQMDQLQFRLLNRTPGAKLYAPQASVAFDLSRVLHLPQSATVPLRHSGIKEGQSRAPRYCKQQIIPALQFGSFPVMTMMVTRAENGTTQIHS